MKKSLKDTYKISPGKELRIALSGSSGCGNTTVSRILSEILNINLINYTFRNIAAERGIPLKTIIEGAKTDFSYDKIVDATQVDLAKKSSCVLGSRLAVWMLPEADLKVYLSASPEVRAARIQKREGGDLNEIRLFTEMRDAEDTRRYKELYGINNRDFSAADIVIDTEKMNPEEIAVEILEKLVEKGLVVKS